MAIPNNLFETFLENIEPDQKAVKYAIKAHKPVREHLESDESFKENVIDTFLYGSYKRHTAVGNIKDVDIVVLTNFDTTDEENTPQKVLSKLKTSLSKFYKDTENPEYQRRSIRINDPLPDKKDSEMTLDIIPTVPITDKDGVLLVPDREVKKWVKSNPKGHIKYITDLNSEEYSKEKFVPLVKIMKSWWKYQCLVIQPKVERPKPKGFWVECLTAENFNPKSQDWGEHFIATLSNISSKYSNVNTVPKLQDPGLQDETIKTSMTFEEFKIFMDAVNVSLKIAQQAYNDSDEAESSEKWQSIFGENFPLAEKLESNKVYFTPPPLPLGDFSHMESLRWPENLVYTVRIDADLYSLDNKKKFRGINSDARFYSNLAILYKAITNTPKPYKAYWQVVNTGTHAASYGIKGLRGQIFPNDDIGASLRRWETSLYTGRHWIECFIVKDGYCVAKRRFYVNIKNPKY